MKFRKLTTLLLASALVACGAFAVANIALGSDSGAIPVAQAAAKKVAKPSKAQLKAFKLASDKFSVELFKKSVASASKNKNVTVAPMSVLNAMAMTANGAGGKTATELSNVLAGGKSVSRLDKNLRWFNSQLVNVKKAHISTANSIWYNTDNGLKIKKKFIKKNKKWLGAEVRGAKFANPSTVKAVNGWVAKKTSNMIKKIVDSLDETEVVLVNAQYFDAKWRFPFEKEATHKMDFTNASGAKSKVKMMHATEGRYIETDAATGFIKPYVKGYSFVALLPAEGTSANDYVATLQPSSLRGLVKRAKQTAVDIAMPKFDISYSNDDMAVQLAAMGITRSFDPDLANFKKMGKPKHGKLYIDQVVHKTKVKVDEEGTKAAAATGIMMKASSAVMEPNPSVVLDRPFVYAIIDNHTKLPLFIGVVNTLK